MDKSLRIRRWTTLVFALLGFCAPGIVISAASGAEYTLGAEDRLKIRVFEWRPVTGSTFEWVPLNGEFVVSAGGKVSLPIIGPLSAAGLTTDQLADLIGDRLKEQVGMQKRPNASVEIAEYRPFYITGLVTKPGRYNYSPGLTVVQALSMAGGTAITTDASLVGLQREAVTERGDLRALQIERMGLLARQARLDAIVHGNTAVAFPEELNSHQNQPSIGRIIREEEDLFATRQRSLAAQIDALNQAKVLATNQIEALKTKAISLAKQIDLANKDMQNVTKLVSAGLTVSSRSLGASQNLSDLESRNLDVSLASLKAAQDVAKSDQDIADAQNRYRVDALTDAADVRDKLSANAEKAETARSLLSIIMEKTPIDVGATSPDEQPSFRTTIDRIIAGKMETLAAVDNEEVYPGDVIKIIRQKPETMEKLASEAEGN